MERGNIQFKLGRNDPCSCNSGRKAKNCCMRGNNKVSFHASGPRGLSGTRFHMYLSFGRDAPRDHGNNGPLGGTPGLYRVELTLGRYGEVQEGGDSLLVNPIARKPDVPAFGLSCGPPSGTINFEGFANGAGRLSQLVASEVQAADFNEAEMKCLHAANVLLSQFAVKFGIPIEVCKSEVRELATGHLRSFIEMPYGPMSLSTELILEASPEFRFYASVYREGLISTSALYRFLCYFKVIEGLTARRQRITKEMISKGETPSGIREIIPNNFDSCRDWLNEIFGMQSEWGTENIDSVIPLRVRGKKFTTVVDELRPTRNAVAHGILGGGEATIMVDEMPLVSEFHSWVALTQCIARSMLHRDFPPVNEPARGHRDSNVMLK